MRYFHFVTFVLVLTSVAATSQRECTHLPAAPAFKRFKQASLIRRVRSVIFPNKGFLLLTPAITKAVLDGRPRGLVYSIEFDMYSPLPDSIEGWQPTILIKKHKKAEEKASPASQNMTSANSRISLNYLNAFEPLYIPHSNQFPVRKHDYMRGYYADIGKIPNALPSHQKQFAQKYTRPHYTHNSYAPPGNANNWSKFGNVPRVQHAHNDVPKWKYHQNYRERRELYEQLETVGNIFHIDMKACIQRAMCEMSTKFMPYGESLMEDLVRIILNIPIDHDFEDDYSPVLRKKQCVKRFLFSCPYSIIDILTKSTRAK